MGLVRMIDVLKGFLDKSQAVWIENGAFMSINVLKGLGVEKGRLGRKWKIDVLKGLLGRKGAFGSKMDILCKIWFSEGIFG